MGTSGPIQLQRIQYWQGQTLGAGDFRAQRATEAELRGWHNRALHQSYGIRFGLAVTAVEHAEAPTLRIDCGLAYDCAGRELVLSYPRRVAVPRPAAHGEPPARVLIIRRRQAVASACGCETAAEPCWPRCEPASLENVDLEWRAARRVGAGEGVALARVTLQDAKYQLDRSFSAPVVRAMARPCLATGNTIPGNTPWEVWYEDLAGADADKRAVAIGMQTEVDTSAAGFTRLPCYFAQLTGPLWDGSNGIFLPVFFPSIANASTSGFTFRLLMRGVVQDVREGSAFQGDVGGFFPAFARRQKLYVCWFGCEENSGPPTKCPGLTPSPEPCAPDRNE